MNRGEWKPTGTTLEKPDRCIGEHELSALIDLSVMTLRNWRIRRKGPRFLKLGAAVKYRLSDVESWLAAQAR